MNLRTTIALVLLVGLGAAGWFFVESRRPVESSSTTLDFLAGLSADKISAVEVFRDGKSKFRLEKTGGEWLLPGKWPVREAEVKQLLGTLASLRSRFTPQSADSLAGGKAAQPNLNAVGLDEMHRLKVAITTGDRTSTLYFGEEPDEKGRFNRPTFAQIEGNAEIVRLGPGVVAALDRTQQYFQQRRLFPLERIAKDEGSKEKVEQLASSEIAIEDGNKKLKIIRKGEDWFVDEPVKDRVDPNKIKTLLAAFPDLWAEKFHEKDDPKLKDVDFAKPEYTLSVTRPNGTKLKLLVGKISDVKTKIVTKPPQQPPTPFAPPPKPQIEMVKEEFRFAKLENNDQVFEIKANKLSDIALSLDALRDPQIARFKIEEVKRIEIDQAGQTIALAKEKKDGVDKWRFEKPTKEDAETAPVSELLEKLAALQVKDKEILDQADLKEVGLAKPAATVKLTLEKEAEKTKDSKDEKAKPAETRTIVLHWGVKEKEKDKVYVKVEPWSRVNQLDDTAWKLVNRPVLAYRNRRVLDIAATDLNKVEIQREGEAFALEKQDGVWKLTAPVSAELDASKTESLTLDLGRLEGVDFIADQPKADDLEKEYGLAKPSLTVKLSYQDAKKSPQTLSVGKQRVGKQEYYARIDQGPVFTLKKDLRDTLDRTSLSYRPLDLVKLAVDDVTEVAIQRGDVGYRLQRDGKDWKVSGRFDAKVPGNEIDGLVEELAKLKAEKFEKHQVKDLAPFGLDKPNLSVKVSAKGQKPKELQIGKAVEGDAKLRYARMEGIEGIFDLPEKTVASLDKSDLDFLDKNLLNVPASDIQKLQVTGALPFGLEKKKEQWQVIDSPAPPFLADDDTVRETLRPWSRLQASKFADYGAKIAWDKYGLDKPSASLTVTVAGEKDKTKSHVIELGIDADAGQVFARVDKKDAVVVLDAGTAAELRKTHLDFVDRRVLKYDLDTVTGIQRQMKDGDFDLVKNDDQWNLVKPTKRRADDKTIGDILEKTFRLTVPRVAEYPSKDFAKFGLEKPFATVKMILTDPSGAAKEHVFKIGDPAKDKKGGTTEERYSVIDKGTSVVVLPAELSKHLMAPPLYFADRNLASFGTVDRAELTRGTRKATFSKAEGAWKMIEPTKADAEESDLDDLIKSLQRLRVEEVIAEKGADLKKFGLDTPSAQWKIKAGDKLVLDLLVGGDAGKGRRFGKLASKEDVFAFDAKLTGRLEEEYRTRKPWPALDAAQVEKLTVTQGKNAFTLRKKDGDWTVSGEIDKTVETKAVTDTLDALAALKAQKYVADAKADLKLYGLDPAEWKIEVSTPMGSRTLHLGRAEGDSKRLYASVAGSDVVFVISEADTARIARTVTAFLANPKK